MEDLKSTLSKLTKTITKTSSDVIKSTKLNINMANEQEKIKEIYIEMGKKVQEIYSYGGELGEFFDKKISELNSALEDIKKLEDEVSKIKGKRDCPKCKTAVSLESSFCPKCGAQMFENKTETKNNENKNKTCPVCGCINNYNDKFCISCGRAL